MYPAVGLGLSLLYWGGVNELEETLEKLKK
jgi:hypothetical protein